MRRVPLAATLLAAASATFGCAHRSAAPSVTRHAGPHPVGPTLEGPASALVQVDTPEGPRFSLFVPGSSAPIPLDLGAEPPTMEDLVRGSDAPWLSADGHTIVYFVAGVPFRHSLAFGTTQTLLPDGPLEREGLRTAATPNARTLLMYRYDRYESGDEGGPIAEGTFVLVDVGDDGAIRSRDVGEDDGAPVIAGLLEDGRWVTSRRPRDPDADAGGSLALVSPDGMDQVVLLEAGYRNSISQLTTNGMHAVYEMGGTIETMALDADDPPTTRRVRVRGGSFAEFQWPTVDPTGTHVAYTHERRREGLGTPYETLVELASSAEAAPRVLLRCEGACRATFETERTILVEDGPRLVRVDVDGGTTVLLARATWIAVRGR